MTPDPEQLTELVAFVREVLGCGCPDEVLANTKYESAPAAFDDLPVDFVLNVGNRLSVAICGRCSAEDMANKLSACAEAGKRFRDDSGFNRFRLVIPTDEKDGIAFRLLRDRFDRLECIDEKLHLHLVDASNIPPMLRSEDPGRFGESPVS